MTTKTKPTPATELPELCYGLLDIELADPSFTAVTPIVIKRGETGYYLTDWSWNKGPHLIEALNHCNAKLGVNPETAERMKAHSMFGWPNKKSERKK
jgi:hypothetical protein